MDRSDVVTLYADTVTYDDYGVAKKVRTARTVFCTVASVTQTEFYEGGRNGLNPEYRIKMFSGNYAGETVIGYNGRMYSVYRTYKSGTDTIELYVERKGGTDYGGGDEEDTAG